MSYFPFIDLLDTGFLKSHRQIIWGGGDTDSIVIDNIDGNVGNVIAVEYNIVVPVVASVRDWFVKPNQVNAVTPTNSWFMNGGAAGAAYTKTNGQLAGNGSGQSAVQQGWMWLDLLLAPDGANNTPRRFNSIDVTGASPPTAADIGVVISNGFWNNFVDPLSSLEFACSDNADPLSPLDGYASGTTFDVYLLATPQT